MKNTEKLLNNFVNSLPNSGHHLDEERFKKFVICSFKEWNIYKDYELKEKLLNYEGDIFTEEQAINFTNKYIDYIEFLKLLYFIEKNNWNFDIIN